MLKIAVWHNLPSGGGKRALYYFVRGLVGRGHKLACWSLDTAAHSYLSLSEFVSERIISSDFKGRSGKSFTDKWRSDFNKTVDRMRAFDQACQLCAHEIEAGDFDVLFANSALHYYVPYIMRHLQMKKVLYLQEPCRFLYEAWPVLPWVSNAPEDLEQADLFRPRRFIADYSLLQTLRLQAKQEWLNVRSCDHVLVNSYFSRESVLRTYGVDAKVCYLGVDTTLFRDLGLPRERVIVGLGSFDSIKGVDLAVKAVALLPEPRPPLVWIANSGNEAYRNAIIELARSLGVELRIQMAISDADLVAILNKATLLLYTSRLEPFGFAPLEANACGLPVVGIAEGGIRETVQDGVNGFLVDPEAESIARAAGQLLQNPALTRQMGERAVINVQRSWNVESSIDRLETILLQAVSAKTGQTG
ncbi:MAG: glycosyltransferase family 1 protein [Acidobacteria bacterium]|nr:MAG: glycosyltransferase family 1 protein [Acidobacteriota bacterium]